MGKKIVLSFVFLSLLLAGLGLVWEHFYNQIQSRQLEESRQVILVEELTADLEKSLNQSLINLITILEVTHSFQENELMQAIEVPSVEFYRNLYRREILEFKLKLEQLKLIIVQEKEFQEQLISLESRFNSYESLSEEWLLLIDDGSSTSSLIFLSSLEPYYRNNISPKILQIRELAKKIQTSKILVLEEEFATARKNNLIASGFSLILGLLLSVYVYRSIALPLKRLNKAANYLGEGDLNIRVNINSDDELGELAAAFNSMAENIQNKTISTSYMDNVLETIQESVFVTDISGNIERSNSAATKLLGYSKEELKGKPLSSFFYLVKDGVDEVSDLQEDKIIEYNLVTRRKIKVPVLFSEASLYEGKKEIGKVNVARDITSLKEQQDKVHNSLKEKDVMLAEIHHRVKNNLAVISGLLQLQSYQTENIDVLKALKDSQLRIQSIALVHEMLYESESLAYIKYDRYVKDLLQAIGSMHIRSDKKIELISETEKVSLSVNQAIPCSLLLNEIIVNSFKHAFSNQETGFVKVELSAKGNRVFITITDNGKGVSESDFNESDSLGTTLVKTLNSQLGGKLEILTPESGIGTSFRIEFEREEKEGKF